MYGAAEEGLVYFSLTRANNLPKVRPVSADSLGLTWQGCDDAGLCVDEQLDKRLGSAVLARCVARLSVPADMSVMHFVQSFAEARKLVGSFAEGSTHVEPVRSRSAPHHSE